MQRKEIAYFLNHSEEIRDASTTQLAELCEEFPYCQTLQVLYAAGLKNTDDIHYEKHLKKASVYAGDRRILYDLLLKESVEKIISEGEKEEDSSGAEVTISKSHSASEDIIEESVSENETNPTEDNSAEHAIEETVIDNNPLEEEILREAIRQTSQLEVEVSMQAYTADEKKEDSSENEEITGSYENEADENLSFSAWLMQDPKATAKKEVPKFTGQKSIIDKFISEDPKISPVKTDFFSPVNMGKLSLMDNEGFVTETLVNIYMKQGEFDKAIRGYTNLSLKYPEKKRYFANLKKKAEDLKNKKTK